jgi:hypothetical protein
MRRPRVYIAGPITKGDLATNIQRGTDAFRTLTLLGYAPWCPHWSCFSGPISADAVGGPFVRASLSGCDLPHADWLAVDCAWVSVADAVLRLPGESTGADAEVKTANECGVPVFHSIEELQAWK